MKGGVFQSGNWTHTEMAGKGEFNLRGKGKRGEKWGRGESD